LSFLPAKTPLAPSRLSDAQRLGQALGIPYPCAKGATRSAFLAALRTFRRPERAGTDGTASTTYTVIRSRFEAFNRIPARVGRRVRLTRAEARVAFKGRLRQLALDYAAIITSDCAFDERAADLINLLSPDDITKQLMAYLFYGYDDECWWSIVDASVSSSRCVPLAPFV